ncbi:hypothetical protein [Pedobacter sp. Leaf170]|uniref:glycoside hydrolase family 130 protein n=1 Tax=Pedobacter sp. Leaf170 TaxID=2876558 RepID=UPI001E4A9995|nr:hypothetical protein [Pedobacter sp. Leaf170]
MIEVDKEGIILEKTDCQFENKGVLNPATIRLGEEVYMFYRAFGEDNISTIGFCKLKGPKRVVWRSQIPLLSPLGVTEDKGIEDPRIVQIEGQYFLTYTAYDGYNALGALATSNDLKVFKRDGIIVPQLSFSEFRKLAECSGRINEKYSRFAHDKLEVINETRLLVWDKDLIFFPRKINGKFYFLHRIKPDIQIASVESLSELNASFWENYLQNFERHIMLSPKLDHEVSYVGGGCPPIETEKGWIIIYHGVHDTPGGYVYCACAALFDLENPGKEISRLPYPLFSPGEEWEKSGKVNNVCFPSGTATFGDRLYIYYGAADECIACASVSLTALIRELLAHA